MCRMISVVTIYLCKHSITPVLADIPQQSIQSCTPLVNKLYTSAYGAADSTRQLIQIY